MATDESVFQRGQQSGHVFDMKRKSSFSRITGSTLPRTMAGIYSDEAPATPQALALQSKKSQIFRLMAHYTPIDTPTIQRSIVNHVEYTLAKTRFSFDDESAYRATAYSIRDRLIETLNDTNSYFFERDVKRCYYLSLEFLVGRAMQNALVNLDIEENYKKALTDLGYKLEVLYEYEHDAALGNGGLGRLAACFLDSMATLNYPCWGYGIRYTYGIFEQKIVNGRQVEHPDYWLAQDNPWEICRHDVTYGVRFYGEVKTVKANDGTLQHRWTGGELVQAVAYDNPVPGFDTYNCINLRLWKAVPSKEFDFKSFNEGKYLDAIAERQNAEYITAVLYPNDESEQGKILRLKQQYFFCCATVQDALRRFKLKPGREWKDLPKKVVMQLNDTHPTVAIPELMRILIDVEGLDWEFAWSLTRQVFNYTNHTVLPEALEKWSVEIFGKLLPRHLLIINEINYHFLVDVRSKMGDNPQEISKMSIYAEGWQKMLRMANLAVIGSNTVNGVAAIHSGLVKRDLFPEFQRFYAKCGQPNKFINVTNGVTPRRWMHCANRPLSSLISEWLGSDSWLKDLTMLEGIVGHIDDPQLVAEWQRVKLRNKRRLAKWVEQLGVVIDPETMLFDVQVKRIHEYKRQLLNCLYMIHRYLTIRKMTPEERKSIVPRATMVGGKAAPGYAVAKTIIKLINNISTVVNNDPDVSPFFKVVFLPNYNVSQAMTIIPAADINQQISTAGTEASGTGNMKFVMNGSLIIGTLDGATVEIREECGEDTVFLFGARESQVAKVRAEAAAGNYPIDPRLEAVFDWIRADNELSLGDPQARQEFREIVDRLTNNRNGFNGDFYLVCHDFADYIRANEDVDKTYKDQTAWHKLAIKAAGSMGKFSTDRTIRDYCHNVWGLEAAERPAPSAPDAPVAAVHAATPVTASPSTPSAPTSAVTTPVSATRPQTPPAATTPTTAPSTPVADITTTTTTTTPAVSSTAKTTASSPTAPAVPKVTPVVTAVSPAAADEAKLIGGGSESGSPAAAASKAQAKAKMR